jgi:hypothetical protein
MKRREAITLLGGVGFLSSLSATGNPPQKPRLLIASRPAHCGEAARFRVRAAI